MEKKLSTHLIVPLSTLGLALSAVFSCSTEGREPYDGPEDPCRHEAFSCGSDMLHFSFTELLPDGEYNVTIYGDGQEAICTIIRSGSNEFDVPIYSVTCESQAFESQVSIDRYGLSIYEYRPEVVTLTIENVASGCILSITEEPHYEAHWSECGETCIDAFVDLDVSELLTDTCRESMGGAGG